MLIAIVTSIRGGYKYDQEHFDKSGLKLGDRIPVQDIDMGQSMTSIVLEGYKGSFNSVFFDFEEHGEELNIYGDPRYNPYLSMYITDE